MNDILTSDHRELDKMLGQLFLAIETGDTLNVFEKLDIFWARLAMHIRAEHLHLFPAILKAAKKNKDNSLENVESSIEQLHTDHNFFMSELAAAMKTLREIVQSDNREFSNEMPLVYKKIDAVSQKLKEHNQLEESKVYCWVDALLDSSESTILIEKMKTELANLPSRLR